MGCNERLLSLLVYGTGFNIIYVSIIHASAHDTNMAQRFSKVMTPNLKYQTFKARLLIMHRLSEGLKEEFKYSAM